MIQIDLVVVCVRVPGHKHLVMDGLHANKVVCCEWPLGATLAEAQEMAICAKARGTRLRFGHGIRGGLRSRGDAPHADRRDRALGR